MYVFLDIYVFPFFSEVNRWGKLVFNAVAGSGIDTYRAYIDKLYEPGKYDNTGNFRSSDIDNWNSLNINKVFVVIHANNKPTAEIRFDIPPGTNNVNWFSPSYVSTNTWNDLTYSISDYRKFSIIGDRQRRFYIYKNYDFCSKLEKGWLVVVDAYTFDCKFDEADNYPVFRHSIDTMCAFNFDDYVEGETFSIFIS
ncbi:Hypothetical predicted protein [Mytilus galloprovincialis]|uniref:Uncharacterized protein n=1 Tax=Mytilus galloprovincialis TaxID=29158 RepID=A0A8B6F6Y7_MYTGA|nr:Hypothetical predicted protein [Mytilus galloprovincialis]